MQVEGSQAPFCVQPGVMLVWGYATWFEPAVVQSRICSRNGSADVDHDVEVVGWGEEDSGLK